MGNFFLSFLFFENKQSKSFKEEIKHNEQRTWITPKEKKPKQIQNPNKLNKNSQADVKAVLL